MILIDAKGDTAAVYTYSTGNRPGYSDEKIRATGDDSPSNWADSAVEGGTPGRSNSISTSDGAGSGELQALPNPFKDYTLISYNLPDASAVRIRVYDVAGRRVRNLLKGGSPRGSVLWDGRDDRGRPLPRGIYIIYLEAVRAGSPDVLKVRRTVAFTGRW